MPGLARFAPRSTSNGMRRMDGCLDFRLLELLRRFFVFESLTVSQFDHALEQHLAYFGSGLVLPGFLDNHDMNRFLWVVNGDRRRLKLAALSHWRSSQRGNHFAPPQLVLATDSITHWNSQTNQISLPPLAGAIFQK